MQNKTNIDYWAMALANPSKRIADLLEKEREYILKHVTSEDCVLDIGCGTGRTLQHAAQVSQQVTGLDIDEEALRRARENPCLSDVELARGSAAALPFKDQTFNVCIMSMVLVNLSEQKITALSEAARVLKKNGSIVISVYSENALPERLRIYKNLGVLIERIEKGTVHFAGSLGMSEQFSIQELQRLCEYSDLKIDSYYEVPDIAYLCTVIKR